MTNPINIPTLTVLDAEAMVGLEGQQGVRLTTREGVSIVLLADARARAALRHAIDGLETAFAPPQGHG
jgi:hypothetical protein